MRSSALVRLAGSLAVGALAVVSLAVPAHAEPAPPVAVDDTISLYPGQSGLVDVLANDSSPSGDDLALCRFPQANLDSLGMSAILAMPLAGLVPDQGPGDVAVFVGPRARGTHEIDYYICDLTHLTAAKLSIDVKAVAPVDVLKSRHRGVLRVTNHNDQAVRFTYGDPRGIRADGAVRLGPGVSKTVRVQRHKISWVALIGGTTGKGSLLDSPGIADFGVVRHIALKGAPLPAPKSASTGHGRSNGLARWAAPRTPAWAR